MAVVKSKLCIYVSQATHFLQWERAEFEKFFELVDEPAHDVILMAFGPDVMQAAAELPALRRYATLFPGFGHNPLYNKAQQKWHRKLIREKYDAVFINPGPLQLAYKNIQNVHMYSFSVNVDAIRFKPRKSVKSILHVSSDYPQKDWQRSEQIMRQTGLKWEVFPPRKDEYFRKRSKRARRVSKIRELVGLTPLREMPHGYIEHKDIIKKYQQYDSFIHVARDIKDEIYIDGKYTAALIEAGLTGAILFWHDTLGLGNNLKTVFSLPLDPDEAAKAIERIIGSIDIEQHSIETHREMKRMFNPRKSVQERAQIMLKGL